MSETTKFMKWDGVCFADFDQAENRSSWRNKDSLGNPPPAPVPGHGATAPSSGPGSGPTLAAQKAEVVLISVSERFAPIEEYAVIELKFKNIEGLGCLVLQIHDADNTLVYAERLTKDMVLRLPDTQDAVEKLVPPLAKATLDANTRKKRRDALWASPVGSPYTFSCWVTNSVCADSSSTAELALDVAAESRAGSNFVEKHRLMSPDTLPPPTLPALPADQTSVRLTGALTAILVPWEQVFEHLTGI